MAAAGDLHCRDIDHGRFRQFVKQVNEEADLLLLCGDLTDHGKVDEARVLAEELSALRVPACAVLGNHDYECGKEQDLMHELQKVGVRCLDGDSYVFQKVLGIAGVKGFGGGFGRGALQAFGEPQTKAFVQEAVNESLKLERALGRLDLPKKLVIMHYSPIPATIVGENPEIYSFLGSSRLMMPIDGYGADAVFHGHAHHGTIQGTTDKGVPVFNVAMPLLQRVRNRRFYVFRIDRPSIEETEFSARGEGAVAVGP
ncbi:MAG: metallophosphoesterase [Myxococcaceae bacterium]|nr:metallophosphoesterase [Myxococcaceae bacterium]